MRTTVILLFVCFTYLINGYASWTKKEDEHAQRLLKALKSDYKYNPIAQYDRAPEMPSHRLVKRDVNITIPIYPWSYDLISWGFVNKDLNFALTVSHQLLVSYDSLMTFHLRNDVPSSDSCFEVEVNPINRNLVFLLGTKASWLSTNGGVLFTRVVTTNAYRGLKFHPTQQNWALAIGIAGSILYVTQDLGKTWKTIGTNVIEGQYDWCRAGLGDITEKRVCAIRTTNNGVSYFMYSNDLGTSWYTPLNERADFFRIHDRFFTLIAEYDNMMDLYVSADDGVTFRRALLPEEIPVGTLQQSQFIEDDYGVIWIVVSPNAIVPGKDVSGNLYVSDADGYKFTLALSEVHTRSNWWDIDLLRSIEGTLLANVMVLSAYIKTKITWDNGAKWNNLEAPSIDSNGTTIVCNDPCSLNLYGITTWLGSGGGFFGPFYSDSNAVGMVIGTGSVGEYLTDKATEVNTYFTRDGGLSWDELMKGSTIYEYGDFGGLLVLASNTAPTNTIYYSLDGGLTFATVQLPEVVSILNIVVASTRNERFIVIANQPGNSLIRKFWGIDFSLIHERNCTDEDYEEWEPHDGVRGPKCVLGHDVTYRRRKREAACYTSDGLNHRVSQENCICDPDRDYECDFEFELTQTTGKCVYFGNNLESDSASLQCINNATYFYISSGYRKLPGDTCTPPLSIFDPTKKKCPDAASESFLSSLSTSSIALIVVGCVILIIIASLFGFCIGLRDERFRKRFPWVKAPSWVHIGYSNELVEPDDGDEDFVGEKKQDLDEDNENILEDDDDDDDEEENVSLDT